MILPMLSDIRLPSYLLPFLRLVTDPHVNGKGLQGKDATKHHWPMCFRRVWMTLAPPHVQPCRRRLSRRRTGFSPSRDERQRLPRGDRRTLLSSNKETLDDRRRFFSHQKSHPEPLLQQLLHRTVSLDFRPPFSSHKEWKARRPWRELRILRRLVSKALSFP